MTLKKELLAGLILIASLTAAQAQTGLPLSGDLIGTFRPVGVAPTAGTHSPEAWGSSFRIGVPMDNSFQSGVSFNGHDFADIRDGAVFPSGLITYYNGINRIGTSSGHALLDLFVQLNGSTDLIPLTTINFGIDATANPRGRPVPDIFRASFVQPEPIRLGDQWVKFMINGLPDSLPVGENSSMDLGSLTVAFIPEPESIGLLFGIAVLCFVVLHRKRELGAV